jgi:hypothetical protein
MAAKTRGGSREQHAKAGKQSHKNDAKIQNPRGGHAAKRRKTPMAEAEAEPGAQQEGGQEQVNE